MWKNTISRATTLIAITLFTTGASQSPETDFLAIRTIIVSATDENGAHVAGLGVGDLELTERGERRDIVEVAANEEQTETLLAVDTSVAFWGQTQVLRNALEPFVQAVTPQNKVSLYEFGGRTVRLTEPTDDAAALIQAIKLLRPQRSEAAYVLDFIVETAKKLGETEREAGNPAQVVIVTSNGPELSHNYHERAKQVGEQSNAVYHVVICESTAGSGDLIHRSEVEGALTYLAQETGGTFNRVLVTTALAKELERIANELRPRYRVSFLTDLSPKSTLAEISITVPNRHVRTEILRMLPEEKKVPVSK